MQKHLRKRNRVNEDNNLTFGDFFKNSDDYDYFLERIYCNQFSLSTSDKERLLMAAFDTYLDETVSSDIDAEVTENTANRVISEFDDAFLGIYDNEAKAAEEYTYQYLDGIMGYNDKIIDLLMRYVDWYRIAKNEYDTEEYTAVEIDKKYGYVACFKF